jgi:hypothetical protein
MEDSFIKWLSWVFFIVISAVFGLLLAFPVMWCWNYTLPAIFHLTTITWGQAWCLQFLAGMFIKSALVDIKR